LLCSAYDSFVLPIAASGDIPERWPKPPRSFRTLDRAVARHISEDCRACVRQSVCDMVNGTVGNRITVDLLVCRRPR
jgi:hypothetical protein